MKGVSTSFPNINPINRVNRVGANYPSLYQAWISTDDNPELAQQNGVTAIPTIIGYKQSSEVARYVGPMTEDHRVDRFIQQVL